MFILFNITLILNYTSSSNLQTRPMQTCSDVLHACEQFASSGLLLFIGINRYFSLYFEIIMKLQINRVANVSHALIRTDVYPGSDEGYRSFFVLRNDRGLSWF